MFPDENEFQYLSFKCVIVIIHFFTETVAQNADNQKTFFNNPNSNAVYSLLFPGTGQMANSQNLQAIRHLGSGLLLHAMHYSLINHENHLTGDDKFDDENKIKFINRPSHWGTTTFRTVLKLLLPV